MIKINRRSFVILMCILVSFFLIFYLSSCKNRRSISSNGTSLSIKEGEDLTKKYCQSCHMLPDPSLLDKKSWENGVLPNMGPRLGIFYYGLKTYPASRYDRFLDTNFYPSKPLLTISEWGKILNYFVSSSPDTLLPPKRKNKIEPGLSLFKAIIPPALIQNPATCFLKINENDSLHQLILSDATTKNIYFLNSHFAATDSLSMGGPVVDIDFSNNKMMACNIGILNPNNGKFGNGQLINFNSHNKAMKDSPDVFSNLQRPVQIVSADFNNDGRNDYLVCEFGFLTGSLSWMENKGQNKYTRHILRPLPGAIKAYIDDYNHDGLKDFWVLFSQGEEGIFLFTNKRNGNFDQEEIIRFPPVYGSSYFEMDDFNKDGYPDILYTCGDNADYSAILKPYHGIYIFINDKTNHFTQKYFFPMNGCYKAIARDYDNDGDLDIAAISFFADYAHQPEEGFVYLNNMGNLNFQPYSIPETQLGRWLTMDAGDINGDGRIDLVLGNFSIGPSLIKSNIDWKKNSSFLVLENTGK